MPSRKRRRPDSRQCSLRSSDPCVPPNLMADKPMFQQAPAVAASSCPSGLSMKSDHSMVQPEHFRGEDIPAAASSCPSGLSMKSDHSMVQPEHFRGEDIPADEGYSRVEVSAGQTALNQSLDLKEVEAEVLEFVKSNMISCQKILNPMGVSEEVKEKEELVDDELILSEAAAKEGFLKIVLHVLKTMKLDAHVFIL